MSYTVNQTNSGGLINHCVLPSSDCDRHGVKDHVTNGRGSTS